MILTCLFFFFFLLSRTLLWQLILLFPCPPLASTPAAMQPLRPFQRLNALVTCTLVSNSDAQIIRRSCNLGNDDPLLRGKKGELETVATLSTRHQVLLKRCWWLNTDEVEGRTMLNAQAIAWKFQRVRKVLLCRAFKGQTPSSSSKEQ